ncbi:MAG: PorV/PorQ family protein [Bacteroidetes bacterium]|nr:PorV/PorQ family protein [Bacteroidota bacterium]MBU1116526.1 PorV/PorQ family protein [Bacteroidota bacterium]MBU1796853.1 PorV/PorQ family protein [Bacteroidota bacterium]
MKKIITYSKNILVQIVLLGFLQISYAGGITKVGTSAAPFLRIPVGARATGMGSAFVSMINDPSALYWNPSALASINSNALMVDHSPWLPGISFDYFGLVLPLSDLGTIGISATVLQTDEMEVTTPTSPMGTGETFTASSISLGISYSKYLTEQFSIGGTFKYIRETIFNSSATGIAFDIGTIYTTPLAGIRLGASISNFGTKMQISGEDLNVRVDIAPGQEGNNQSIVGKLNTDEFDLPLLMRIGISGELLNTNNLRWTIAVDGVNPNDNSQSVNIGTELGFLNELVRIRAGYTELFLEDSEANLTFGVSLNEIKVISNILISVEYAYQNFVHLGNSNRFSVMIKY